jgi:pentatricopeptide repeat protein
LPSFTPWLCPHTHHSHRPTLLSPISLSPSLRVSVTFNILLNYCASHGDVPAALDVMQLMCRPPAHAHPHAHTQTSAPMHTDADAAAPAAPGGGGGGWAGGGGLRGPDDGTHNTLMELCVRENDVVRCACVRAMWLLN